MSSAGVSRGRDLGSWLDLMRDLAARLPVAVAVLSGPDLVFEFVNDEYRRLVGDRDLLGLPVRDALPELAGQGYVRRLDEAMRSGQALRGHEAEVWIRRTGMRQDHVFVDFVFQPISDGAVTGALLLVTDVTQNVRDRDDPDGLATQLALSQERYRTLFDTLPEGVIYYAADGRIIEANPAASEILGVDADAMIAWPLPETLAAMSEDGKPLRPEDFPVMQALRTGQVIVDVVLGVPHGRTGHLRWLRVTAVPDARDADGQPQRAYAMFRDLTDERRAQATLREGNELMGRLRDANVLGVVIVGEGQVLDANEAFLGIIGYSRADLKAGRLSVRGLTAPEWNSRDDDALQQLRRTGVFRPYEKEYIHRGGHRVPVLVGAAVIDRDPLRWVTYVVDLTARQRAEEERADLVARERAARAEAATAADQLTFLLQAGDLVAAAQDRHDLLQHASQLVVRSLADFCMVYLPGPDGGLRATSIAHRDADREVAFADLRDEPTPTMGGQTSYSAYTTGISQLVHDFGARLSRRPDVVAPVRDVMARLRPDNVLVTPLKAGQRPLGVLTAGRAGDQPPFARTDIAVLEELARRVAVGLANADISARDHSVAETLQRSVLPDELPQIRGLDLAVRYLPGTADMDVGGDWYDAFRLDERHVGLVVGDVVGHNITSASIMSQVRNLLRAYAVDDPSPADVLRRTNAALARLMPDAMATAIFAVLDQATGQLSYANAGHPPPVCVAPDGQVDYLDDAPGTMLGAPGASFSAGCRQLTSGTGLLLFTDGLIEDRRRDITEGLSRLGDAMRQAAGVSAEQTCTTVQAALLGTSGRADDVCLLAARTTGCAG